MLVATRSISIGEYVLNAGDPVTPEMQQVLPPNRLLKLEHAGWIREQVEDPADVADLARRLAALEDTVTALVKQSSKPRGPRAPESQE